MSTYKITVGIEVHAELRTKSKMFCGCPNDPHASAPNTNICPVCMAHPGTLPAVNKEAVEAVLRVGNAIGGSLADFSEFDRKNYFYPDIPKAYQISQYAHPLVSGGELAGVSITRIHLEEDTARSQHADGNSLVDFNRAGVPLMELVTEPVIHDPATAGKFARELQLLLRTLGVSDANMEKGEMRVEANISVSNSEVLGTKVEVKNLNSFRAMESAITYEAERQAHILEEGGTVQQETRGWDEQKSVTFSQRIKESADDYRYFPDPDIPKFVLSQVPELSKSRLSEKQPKLASELRDEYRELGLNPEHVEALMTNLEAVNFYELVRAADAGLSEAAAKLALSYLISDVFGLLGTKVPSLEGAKAASYARLMVMLAEDKINSRTAKDLLVEVLTTAVDPQDLAEKRGLLQKNDPTELQPMIEQIIAEFPSVVEEYKAGKEASLQFLVGQGMKQSKGAANPQLLAELLRTHILG